MKKCNLLVTALELIVMLAISIMFWYAALAQGQYGNPNDPYLDYQRIERERESLELQRRQVEALERAEQRSWLQPLPVPQLIDPWDPYVQGEPE